MYLLYYLGAGEYPVRPIVTGVVNVQSVITYSFERWMNVIWVFLLIMILM
jgi:hypothetical protein